jgi:hypothetical protein
MKRICIFLFVAFIFFGCSNKIIRNRSVGNIVLGTRVSDFLIKQYLLKKIIIKTTDDKIITDIILLDDSYKLENGISVNSTVEELKEKYHLDFYESKEDSSFFKPLHFSGTLAGPPGSKDYDDIQVGDIGGMSFFISDGRVIAIRLYDEDFYF